ncbi:MAG: hypothetical protein WC728_14745 [Elusimicrobiota bacterium]
MPTSPIRLGLVDFSILLLYLAAVVLLGLRAARRRREGTEDYILASRTLTLPSFVATLVPSFFGGTLGVGEYAYRFGVSNWLAQGVPYYAFALLYAAFLAPRIRKAPGLTLPDHLHAAFGKPCAVLAAFLVFLLASPADELLMLGTLAHWASGLPLAPCLAGVAAACVGFLFTGGLRSDVWANRLEFLFMFGGFSIILPFAYLALGGAGALAARLPPSHLDWTGGNPPAYLITWFFIALWTFVDPSFHQRVCAARDAATARAGICVSVAFWCCFDFMTTTTGLYARALLPGLEQPLQAFPALAQDLLPPAIKGLFLAGVASSTLAALGTTSFLAAVSIGRDLAGRLLGVGEARHEYWIRWGLLATCLLSFGMALAMPSVVDLWYTVGSCVIPGLLVPLLAAYFEPLRIPPWAAFSASLAGFLGSLLAWARGSAFPFYPGLALSILAWIAGKLSTASSRPEA